ncbi:MAG TPA: 23S rRNA (adenine(2503)-C(2))-methyltransferase RlmN [Tepidisphaeraceae bacterium]|nr:23S rRNA (adenine(2503)-C(2))-methyltransferase RlmN [Tepidisphaeraceae bacterium]
MPSDPPSPCKLPFLGLTAQSATAELGAWGWPPFRVTQLYDWVYQKMVTEPQLMTNFSKSNRATLQERLEFTTASITRQQNSTDGTTKLLLTWPDGKNAETVLIPDGPRRTACVSSQVGCPVGCKFCASGIEGVKGNLSAAQIVEQVYELNRLLAPQGERISNIVFMGMGEPLANYAPVMSAVRVLHEPAGFNIGARKITISTVGIPSRIRDLAHEQLPLNLALSLHAPNEPLRRELIPWADHFALPDILNACRYYFDRTGREITFEYILLSGVNDQPKHARELVRVCKTIRANVNLIRYNEVAALPYGRPKSDDVLKFQEILREGGVNVHVRKSRGRDIDAACGQLRRREQQESKPSLLPIL